MIRLVLVAMVMSAVAVSLSGCAGLMDQLKMKSAAEVSASPAVTTPASTPPVVAQTPVVPRVESEPQAVAKGDVVAVETSSGNNYTGSEDNPLLKNASSVTIRLTDNGNGTVTDKLTGLVWLKSPACFKPQSWDNAILAVSKLASGVCGLKDGSTPGQWRLPTVLELRSLVETDSPLKLVKEPFPEVKLEKYWTANTFAGNPKNAWYVYTYQGSEDHDGRENDFNVWPVRKK